MGLSYTIAKERLFEPLRRRLGGHERMLGYLVSCPYCVSHWIAFVLVPMTGCYRVRVAFHVPVLTPICDWFLSSILVTVVAAFLRVIFFFVDETQGFVRRRKRVAERVEERVERALDDDTLPLH